MTAARGLLRHELPALARVRAIVGDRAYRGLARLARHKGVNLDLKAPPPGGERVHAGLAALEDRARLRSARPLAPPVALLRGIGGKRPAWLEVASVGYLAWRASV